MELTKQHKVLAGILSLGVGAIIIDRAVLSSSVSGPSKASASVSASEAKRQCATPSNAVLETLTSRASHIETITVDDTVVANAFIAPVGWAATERNTQEIADTSGSSIASGQFRLSSVMTRPVAAAVVNGHMLRAGQSYAFGVCSDGKFGLMKQEELRQQQKSGGAGINTVRLISVEPRSEDTLGGAVIEVDGVQVTLAIEQSEKHK